MNKRMILYILAMLLLIEAAFMLLPLAAGLIYAERASIYFVYTIVGTAAVGALLLVFAKPKNKNIYAKEGLLTVALGWIVMSLAGAAPFALSGEIPSYLDAVFETVSGFTTTGSSILANSEELSRCMLFWRSFSHWIGGMGILVFMLTIMHMEGGQGMHLLRAESPGPSVSKMVPRMVDSSKILYGIYIALTIIEVGFYMAGGMPLFDSLCNAFGTAGTGGFSIKAASMGAYSRYAQTVTTVFMALFGMNFSIYFFMLRKKFDLVYKNTEIRWYLVILLSSILLVTINTLSMYPRAGDALHHAAFSVTSIMTTTGYCTVDFYYWPEFSKVILVLLMYVGACAGSTGGGIKVSRIVILVRAAATDIRKLVHPHTVKVVKIDGKTVSQDAVRAVEGYFILYVLIGAVSCLLVSFDNFDGSTTLTAVMATFNNIGPGLGIVGPTGNYAMFSPLSKIVLCFDMLFGRLEIYPMLILMLPRTWFKRI